MKPKIRSKTLWLNVCLISVSILGLLQSHELIAGYPKVVGLIGLTSGILGIVIRFYTNKPLKPLR